MKMEGPSIDGRIRRPCLLGIVCTGVIGRFGNVGGDQRLAGIVRGDGARGRVKRKTPRRH